MVAHRLAFVGHKAALRFFKKNCTVFMRCKHASALSSVWSRMRQIEITDFMIEVIRVEKLLQFFSSI